MDVSSNGGHQLLEKRLASNGSLFRQKLQGKTFVGKKQPTSDEERPYRHNILIVDDIPAVLNMLRDLFTRLGYNVQTVSTGKAALRAVQTTPPDLVLLDIDLPDIVGFEVCRQLKCKQATHDIPVIFMSGSDVTQNEAKALEVGGSDYLVKPFRIREAIAAVEACLTANDFK